ncbi:Tumor necrosis factor receptor superfamily member 5 [Channa argus]|uniref:Tumor necrosis factor receptor superfamily member 5 n=1 Tax=Channa argus TaxID=215402 RepID=A0A6G1PPK1_CHAAH|nr:Tumor necrosis factor receptor superfamily member 5 [Channa argus]KAK2910093.1 hypothetical protein Q8A73_007808 [Channa argus]
MGKMTCQSDDFYPKNGRCCNRCSAGKYVKEDCNDTQQTRCAECARDQYTATKNGANRCQKCDECSSDNKQEKLKDCTSTENTVCGCIPGFYCNNEKCDHCLPVKICQLGEGVKIQVSRTNNTVCAPCEKGTYSNVSDYSSPCKPHTRCEDVWRVLKTPGTEKADAVCGDFSHRCPWVLPAVLWAGLVLTALILFAIVICRKAKRKSYRAGSLSGRATLVQVVPATSLDLPLPATSQDLPLTSPKPNGYCQESCTIDDFNLSLFHPDDNLVSSSIDSSLPITPLKVSVSFAEPTYIKSSGYCTSEYLGIQSEPQEDEWCGT